MIAQILITLVCLMMFALGMASMFAPKVMLNNFAIEPLGAVGLNTIRGVIGGFFLGSVAMLITGLVTGETVLFLTVAVLLGAVAFGRLVGLIFDGFNTSVMPPLMVEIIMVAILVAAPIVF